MLGEETRNGGLDLWQNLVVEVLNRVNYLILHLYENKVRTPFPVAVYLKKHSNGSAEHFS